MKLFDFFIALLVIAGAINWGTVGFFDFNLISFFFCNPIVHRVIFCAIGVAGIYWIVSIKGIKSRWTGR